MGRIKFKFEISPETREIIDKNTAIYREAGKYRYSNPARRAQMLQNWMTEIINLRSDALKNIETGSPEQVYQKRMSVLSAWSQREKMIDIMVMFDWTFDPRNTGLKIPVTIPFIPWQKQIDFLEFIYFLYFNQEKGCAVKARDQGGSYLALRFMLHEWRWITGFLGGCGSQKEKKVDEKGNMNALFPKLRFMYQMYPKWWFPDDFDERIHDNKLVLKNPENNNSITGDIGDQIGRGGRTSFYLLDEASFLQSYAAVEQALSRNTDSALELTTPNGFEKFAQKYHSGKVPTFCFDWWDDPRVDDEWLAHFKETTDEVVVAQEVLHDFYASVEGIMIDAKWVDAAVKIELEPKGICGAGLDVAAGGKNNSALCIRRGPVAKVWAKNYGNGIKLTRFVIDYCNEANVDYLNYDEIGVGFAVDSALEVINEDKEDVQEIRFNYFGVNAGGRASNMKYPEFRDKYGYEIFADARSEWWYLIKMRFKRTWQYVTYPGKFNFEPDELISIEDDSRLRRQLSSPLEFRTTTGKIKVESKDSMLKRGIESPDEADALVMANIPQDAGNKHVVDAGFASGIYSDIKVDPGRIHKTKILHYGAICVTQDIRIHCLCSAYDEMHGHLYIYDELYSDNISAGYIVPAIVSKMNMKKALIDKLMGNKIMFSEEKRNMKREYDNAFYDECGRFQTVAIKEPRIYDPMGSMVSLNDLMKAGKITADPCCLELKKALVGWRVEKGKFAPTGFREALLMIVSELTQVVPIEEIMKMKEYLPYQPKLGLEKKETKIGI